MAGSDDGQHKDTPSDPQLLLFCASCFFPSLTFFSFLAVISLPALALDSLLVSGIQSRDTKRIGLFLVPFSPATRRRCRQKLINNRREIAQHTDTHTDVKDARIKRDMFPYSVPFKRQKEEKGNRPPPNSHSLALSPSFAVFGTVFLSFWSVLCCNLTLTSLCLPVSLPPHESPAARINF